MLKLCLTLCALVFTPLALANTELFSAEYEGEYSGWDIVMVRSLSKTPEGHYILRSEAKNFFASITETSQFNLTNSGLMALEYEYYRKVFGRKKVERLAFDHTAGKAKYFKNQDLKFTHDLNKTISDPALYQLMLQLTFSTGTEAANFHFLKRKTVKDYSFSLLAEDTLSIGKQQYKALVVERKSESKRTKIWIVPEQDFTIGKIEHTDDDNDTYVLTLTKYSANKGLMTNFMAEAKAKHPL